MNAAFIFFFLSANVQKTNINIRLHTLSFSILKTENNLQYNFHIIHVLKLFVCNVCIIQVNRQSRRQKIYNAKFYVGTHDLFVREIEKELEDMRIYKSNFVTV